MIERLQEAVMTPMGSRMWRGIVTLAAAGALAVGPVASGTAFADDMGPVCVEDGDTLVIDGHRSYGACEGGRTVILYGIDAPELEQTCQARGKAWECGRQAAATLLNMTLKKTVTCLGNSYDRDDRLVAECSAGGVNLNRMMVRQGLAVTDGPRYAREEGLARAEGVGMWMGTFDRPADWRAKHE
jgi:endonuclease YncB( thermonuclease family)